MLLVSFWDPQEPLGLAQNPPHPCGELRYSVRQGGSLGLTETQIVSATRCTPQPLWGLRWTGVGWSGVEQIPFKPNRHTPTPLQAAGSLLKSWVHQAEFFEFGEASGVLVVLSLPVPQVGPKATLPRQLRPVPAELGLDSERPDVVRGWPRCITASSTQSSVLKP